MDFIWNYIQGNLDVILTFVIGIAAVWAVVSKASIVLKETGELFVVFAAALADGKITKEEIAQVVKEGKDVVDAVKTLMVKKVK